MEKWEDYYIGSSTNGPTLFLSVGKKDAGFEHIHVHK